MCSTYICGTCNETFPEPYTKVWKRNGHVYADEVCPWCGSEDITEGEMCPSCGDEWIRFDDELCDYCKSDLNERFFDFRKEIMEDMSITKKMFEEYLTAWLERN